MLLCLLLTDIGLYFAGQSSAQNAADAAALAAVQQSFFLLSSGSEPESAARDIAKANGASLNSVKVLRGGEKVEVEVSVRPNSMILGKMGIMPCEIRERAAAEIDIAALMESDLFWYLGDIEDAELVTKLLSTPGLEVNGTISTMVVLLGMQHLGKPYVWGGNGPDCFDCSGLVRYVYAQIGIRLPRTTFAQVNTGNRVNFNDIVPGDLVFFRNNAHVGIYAGGGLYIHAPHTGDVVKVSRLSGKRDVSACVRII
ncbi:MAG: C40 family peptidase [Actinobacteria bacterium]|nr:C40 family peptidase [Actinomycetota bacterium]